MNTLTISTAHDAIQENNLPKTGRGRALYTVAWFLNGRPVSVACDSHGHASLSNIIPQKN